LIPTMGITPIFIHHNNYPQTEYLKISIIFITHKYF